MYGCTQSTGVGLTQDEELFKNFDLHEDYITEFMSEKQNMISFNDLQGTKKFHITKEVIQYFEEKWDE